MDILIKQVNTKVETDSRYKEQGLAQKATCWWLSGVALGCVEAVEAVGAIGWRWWRLERDFDNNGQITIGSAPAGSVVMD